MVKKTTTKAEQEIGAIQYLDVLSLHPNPYQPDSRLQVDPETAKKFALSFQEHGLIQTPIVRVFDGHYEIADGWLRRAGFLFNLQEFGLQEYTKMPCVVRELTDQQMADMVMETNTVRKDLNPIELAIFYKRYLEDFKIPQAELARRHNCSQGEIANTIRLLDLPEDIQGKIISQEITETHGRQLLRLNYSADLQQEVLKDTIEEKSSVNELSNRIANKIWWSTENIDPNDYPKPPFDTAGCTTCPNRQKLGYPGSNERKKWRCLDKKCYAEKEEEAEKERVAEMSKEIAKAKAKVGKDDGKGKEAKVAVIDCEKLGWRDFQELDGWKKIDNPEECKTCEYRAVGKFYNKRHGPICLNVKCFQAKEKALQAKQAAEGRKAEQELSQQVKAVCENASDETAMCKVISGYLLAHCRKDTRERFFKLYGITDTGEYFAPGEKVDVLARMAALALQIERYEGETGRFMKWMAGLAGTGAELETRIAAFVEAHCKTCENSSELGGCSSLMRVYPEEKCWRYRKMEEETATEQVEQPAGKSEHQEIMDSLPCKDCENAPTCDRSFFHTDGQDGYVCDRKVSAGAREEVAHEV